MRLRSFIIGYALVPALLLFALTRHPPRQPNHYSQVLDLTEAAVTKTGVSVQSRTRIISPAAMLPGTWAAAQIPAERLIGPLVKSGCPIDANADVRCFVTLKMHPA
jgi:hypothetical protein